MSYYKDLNCIKASFNSNHNIYHNYLFQLVKVILLVINNKYYH